MDFEKFFSKLDYFCEMEKGKMIFLVKIP